jgi:methylated-DNA-[protein]-cysteine S-methyltransferase
MDSEIDRGMNSSCSLFETPLGSCGIAWIPGGITRFQLPEASPRRTLRRLLGEEGAKEASPPPWVAEAMDRIRSLLSGKRQDLSDIPLDMAAIPPFHRRVYQAARGIPPGKTVTYRELASRAGSPKAGRAVGQALARNPFAILVPCHRVLGAGGRPVGFSARGGCRTKLKLLALEGAEIEEKRIRAAAAPEAGGSSSPSLFAGEGTVALDPAGAARALSASDPVLGKVMDRVGPFGLRPESMQTTFQALAEAILYQQLNGRAAATILLRLKRLYGRGRFPRPAELLATSEDRLRSAGLSANKQAALRDLAAKTLDGTVPPVARLRRLSDEAIVRRLDSVRGIGRWTVEMLLIFRLGRPDVLPVDDYGVRKGFQRTFRTAGLPTRAEVARRGERWRPFRTVASWYLWRAAELPPG